MRNKNKNGFKISGKSKNVTKLKSKTPAQDRLQKFQNVLPSNLDDCKKLVLENAIKSAAITKPCTNTNVSNEPVRYIANKDSIESAYAGKADSKEKMAKANPFKIDDAKGQNSLKMSDKSKIVKKYKPKTQAQNRLLKCPKLLSSNLIELSTASLNDIEHKNNQRDSAKSIRTIETNNNSVDSAQEQNIDKSERSKDDVPADGRVKEEVKGFGSQFIQEKPSDVCEKEKDTTVDGATISFRQLESMTVNILTDSVTSYLVPDTNVFIQSLASIKAIIEDESNLKKPNIVIPFVVLQELDQLKRRGYSESVKLNSIRAIGYIYDQLKSKNQRLQGQKAIKDCDHIIEVSSPDDKILNCCLQLKNESKSVTLVTNDKNLSIKAIINGIETITAKKCLDIY